jgi:diguanylate cyclase (GGDEF)-like protein
MGSPQKRKKTTQKKKKPIGKEYIDDLTSLYNRRYLLLTAPERIKKSKQSGTPISLAVIDLDFFKNVNDTYGHARGDIVLRQFGKFLKKLIRENDIVCRYGGDEFVCLLYNANYEQATHISNRFIKMCRESEFGKTKITMSVGIATSPTHAEDWNSLFNIADRNLYSAKRHGRDRIGFFEKVRKRLNIPVKKIVGRTSEIEEIRNFITLPSLSSNCSICIAGEVGVGKTRLIREVMKTSPFKNLLRFHSNMSATTQSIPYYPFREIIRNIVEEEGLKNISKLPKAYQLEIVKILPELSEVSESSVNDVKIVDKFRLFEAVRCFLEMHGRKKPFVFFLDNIHWSDDGSAELVHYLMRKRGHHPMVFFLIYRTEEIKNTCFEHILRQIARENPHKEIRLSPLTREGVAQLLSLILDSVTSDELIDYVFSETGGNPFFIEELLKNLESNGALTWNNSRWLLNSEKRINIPYSIEGVVEIKLQLISGEAQDLLEIASVLGREFDFSLLRSITNLNEGMFFDLLDETVSVGLLKESKYEKYYFSEDLIRETIYNRINKAKLIQYHKRVAQSLLELNKDRIPEVVNELTYHFFLSRDFENTIKYGMIAANKAREAYVHSNALKSYAMVLESLHSQKDYDRKKELECYRNRANILCLTGNNEQAKEEIEKALLIAENMNDKRELALCFNVLVRFLRDTAQYTKALEKATEMYSLYKSIKDKEGIATSLNSIGIMHDNLGEYDEALKYYNKALKISREIGDKKNIAQSLNNIGIIYDNQGKYKKALQAFETTLSIREKMGDKPGQAATLNNIGVIWSNVGDYKKALNHYQRSLTLTEEFGSSYGQAINYNNIGIIHEYKGEFEKSLEYYDRALTIRKAIGDKHGEGSCLQNIGNIHSHLGDYEISLNCNKQSLNLHKLIGDRHGESANLYNIAAIHKFHGNIPLARKIHKQALQIRQEIGARLEEAISLSALAGTYIDTRRFTQAKKLLKQALAIANDLNSKFLLFIVHRDLSSFYLEKGELSETQSHIEKIKKLSEELDSDFYRAQLLSLQGQFNTQLEKWNKAEKDLKNAIVLFKKMRYLLSTNKTYLSLGLLYSKIGRNTLAKKYLTMALTSFSRLGAKKLEDKAKKFLSKIKKKKK